MVTEIMITTPQASVFSQLCVSSYYRNFFEFWMFSTNRCRDVRQPRQKLGWKWDLSFQKKWKFGSHQHINLLCSILSLCVHVMSCKVVMELTILTRPAIVSLARWVLILSRASSRIDPMHGAQADNIRREAFSNTVIT